MESVQVLGQSRTDNGRIGRKTINGLGLTA